MPVQSDEYKAVKAFVKAIGGIDFRPNLFAVNLAYHSIAIQTRVIDCLMAVIDLYALALDEGITTPANYDLCVKAKRVQDAMTYFR